MMLIPQVCLVQGQREKLGCVFSCRPPSYYSAGKSKGLLNVKEGFIQPSGLYLIQVWKDVLLLEFTSSLVMFRADAVC